MPRTLCKVKGILSHTYDMESPSSCTPSVAQSSLVFLKPNLLPDVLHVRTCIQLSTVTIFLWASPRKVY